MKNAQPKLHKVNLHHDTVNKYYDYGSSAAWFPSHGLLTIKESSRSVDLESPCRLSRDWLPFIYLLIYLFISDQKEYNLEANVMIIHCVCPTRYRTRHFFNNCNNNEDIAMKFEQECVRCVRNEEECVCSACLWCVSVVYVRSVCP